MIILILFAFLAGIVTVLSPCILPVLPVVLSGSVGGGKRRPLGIITGFVVSFTVFTLALSALVSLLGISADVLRWVAAGLIFVFGLVMVVPPLKNAFMRLVAGLSSAGSRQSDPNKKSGYGSGLILGLSLGLVWTPCVGPIIASVITLALTASVDFGSVLIVLAYSLGTALPLFLIMIGGRGLLKRVPFFTTHSAGIQKVFGVLMILTAVALMTGLDRQFQTFILQAVPNYGAGLTSLEDQGFIRAELEKREGIATESQDVRGQSSLLDSISLGGPWINTEPLSASDFEGKVVMIDFWTYSCINCIRTFPYLKAWDETYRNRGLVIIGVHSPEFAFERDTGNVQRAVRDYGLRYPVVQDNDFAVWRTFNNRYWPAHYLFDRSGALKYTHFGEGKYEETEKVIQTLLGEMGGSLAAERIPSTASRTRSLTPETYLGYGRAKDFSSPEVTIGDQVQAFTFPSRLESGEWALSGKWVREEERIRSTGAGSLELSFRAEKVYLVLGPVEDGVHPTITVTVDGKRVETPDVKNGTFQVNEYRLYQLYDGDESMEGVLRLEAAGPLAAYAFTFG